MNFYNLSKRYGSSPFWGNIAGRLIGLVVFVCILFPSRFVMAEDLIQLYQAALKKDPTFQGQQYRHKAAPEVLKQAYAEMLPTVTAEGTRNNTKQEIVTSEIAVYGEGISRYPGNTYNLTLSQPLLRFPSIVRLSQAQEEVRQADIELELAKQDLILRVATTYLQALEALDNLSFTGSEESAVKAHFELAQERFKAGLAPITDFHDAKARLANVTTRRVLAENRVDDAFEALAEIAGVRVTHIVRLITEPIEIETLRTRGRNSEERPSLNPVPEKNEQEEISGGMPLLDPNPDDLDVWIKTSMEQNLKIEAQRRAVKVAEHEIERQRMEHLPTLSLVGRMNRDEQKGSLFSGGSDVKSREALLQLRLPIFQGGKVMSKTREAMQLHRAEQEGLEKVIRFVKRETRSAFLGVKSAIKNIRALRQSVISNLIALEAKREGFKAGLFPSLAVLDAERDLHQARLSFVTSQYEYILNNFRLKKAVGTLNEDDLQGVNQWLK